MTPDDAIAALRRAFPAVADEGVERFRRELEPIEPPFWSLADSVDVYAEVYAPEGQVRCRWYAWTSAGKVAGQAPTRAAAWRAASAALGLPACKVVT